MYEGTENVAHYLVHSLTDGISLRIAACRGRASDPEYFEKLLEFPADEFTSIVMKTFVWFRVPA